MHYQLMPTLGRWWEHPDHISVSNFANYLSDLIEISGIMIFPVEMWTGEVRDDAKQLGQNEILNQNDWIYNSLLFPEFPKNLLNMRLIIISCPSDHKDQITNTQHWILACQIIYLCLEMFQPAAAATTWWHHFQINAHYHNQHPIILGIL